MLILLSYSTDISQHDAFAVHTICTMGSLWILLSESINYQLYYIAELKNEKLFSMLLRN